jgi:diguanylate cyclase (GGDEF)-like protein
MRFGEPAVEGIVRTACCNRVRTRLQPVRAWPLWQLPRWLVTFLAGVAVAYGAVAVLLLPTATLTVHQLVLLGALLACLVATVELTRRAGENVGLIVDIYGVWELPIAILLPPLYALAVPALRWVLNQWRVRRIPLHRRIFSGAVTGLSYAGASLVFHAVGGAGLEAAISPLTHPTAWILAVTAAVVTQWAANTALLMPAIKGSDRAVSVRKLLLARETVHNDIAELCVAVLVTTALAVSTLTIVFALPLVTLLQRSLRHAQLVNASRIDSKTGLLNAGTWEREAAVEVARAVRTRSPLAVALIDVDHFKAINDTHGHLAGDQALKAVARTLTAFLREYDLVGRFGGEEFALLLPQARPVDAYQIAERMRAYIAAMPIDVGNASGEPVRLTVSIGVAAVGTRWDTSTGGQLTDLLAAADGALYKAKRDGRDRVCVLTENATFDGRTAPGAYAEVTAALETATAGRPDPSA